MRIVGIDPRVSDKREPSCIHSPSHAPQPMSVCIVCKDSPVLAAWKKYWKEKCDKNRRN